MTKAEELIDRPYKEWWLVDISAGGLKLVDGPHEGFSGVEEAAYLIERLGLKKNRKFALATIEVQNVVPRPHNVNEDAIQTLNDIGLRPKK